MFYKLRRAKSDTSLCAVLSLGEKLEKSGFLFRIQLLSFKNFCRQFRSYKIFLVSYYRF